MRLNEGMFLEMMNIRKKSSRIFRAQTILSQTVLQQTPPAEQLLDPSLRSVGDAHVMSCAQRSTVPLLGGSRYWLHLVAIYLMARGLTTKPRSLAEFCRRDIGSSTLPRPLWTPQNWVPEGKLIFESKPPWWYIPTTY